MKTKGDSSFNNKHANVFSALENQPLHKSFKNIQPHKSAVEKENWNSHVFVSSPYKNEQVHHASSVYKQQPLKVVRQTFTTNKNNEKAEVTFAGRPTMGGKTISAIHHLPATTTLHHHNRMSSQELKLLSRRINPHEPLSSPHASPKKPPLPNLVRKRLFKDKENVLPEPKKKKADYEFTCEPCKKVYKTRAGYSYHKDKCKYHKFEAASKAVIHCVCDNPSDDTGTMIECIKCNRWLHLKCAGGVTKEESYCCPRCIETTRLFEQTNKQEDDQEQVLQALHLPALAQANELPLPQEQQENDYGFINLLSEMTQDNNITFMPGSSPSPQLPSSIVNDDFWNSKHSTDDFTDLNSSTWCNEDLPSLLFSDNNPSFIEDFSTNDIPSSPINQSDWFQFANFDSDFNF